MFEKPVASDAGLKRMIIVVDETGFLVIIVDIMHTTILGGGFRNPSHVKNHTC
jgi:hypothetical protein